MTKWIKIRVDDDVDVKELNQLNDLTTGGWKLVGTPGYGNEEQEFEHFNIHECWHPKYLKVHDHGFVGLIDFFGDDNTIVQAARVSYGTGTKRSSSDRGLIRYLMRHHHCYHPDMEVLTATGWKRWNQVDQIETYMVPDPSTRTLHPETLSLEQFDVDTELYTFDNERMSYAVTKDHRMWVKGKYQDDFGIVKVQDMTKWGHFDPLVGYRAVDSKTIPDRVFEFIGFFLGDGSYASTNRITFHLKKDRKKQYLLELLDDLHIQYEVKPSKTDENIVTIWVHTPDFIRNHIDVTCRTKDKALITNITDMDGSEILGLWTGLVNSDGSYKTNRSGQIEFSSVSDDLINLFETLSAFIGMDAHRRKLDGRICAYNAEGRTSLESRKQYHGKIKYSGKVYCTTTSTGLLVVRGGPDKFGFICGNTTPFEMAEVMFHIKAPIFVFRQWQRHRTANINEYSARYSKMSSDMYVPEQSYLSAQSSTNKQGRDDQPVDDQEYKAIVEAMEHVFRESIETYNYLLGEADPFGHVKAPSAIQDRRLWAEQAALEAVKKMKTNGVEVNEKVLTDKITEYVEANNCHTLPDGFSGIARELARIVVPVAVYSEMYWKCDLHNLFHFLTLRTDSHAQQEIQDYANTMLDLIHDHYPWAIEAWKDYRKNARTFSRMEMETLLEIFDHTDINTRQKLFEQIKISMKEKNCSDREIREFLEYLHAERPAEA